MMNRAPVPIGKIVGIQASPRRPEQTVLPRPSRRCFFVFSASTPFDLVLPADRLRGGYNQPFCRANRYASMRLPTPSLPMASDR